MARFEEALDDVLKELRAAGIDHPVPPTMLEEAARVEACVDRFVYGELDPTRAMSVSRTPFPGSPPSLAQKLGRKLDGASPEVLDKLGNAVAKSLGTGYLCHCADSQDAAFVPGRTAEDVWDFWAPSCRDMLESVGIPREWANNVRHLGSDLLIADLKDLGLTRFLGGSKLGQLGFFYASAGVLLRMAQTTVIADEHFDWTVERVRDVPDRRWHFDAYPIASE